MKLRLILLSVLGLSGCNTLGWRLPVPLAQLPQPVAVQKLRDLESSSERQFGWPAALNDSAQEHTWQFTVQRGMEVRNVALTCGSTFRKSACSSLSLKCRFSNSDLRFVLEHSQAGDFLLQMSSKDSGESPSRMSRLDPVDLAPASPHLSAPPSYAPQLMHRDTEAEPLEWALQVASTELDGKLRSTGYGPSDAEFNLIYSDGEELYSAINREHADFVEVSALLAFVGELYAHNAGSYHFCPETQKP